MDLLNRLASLDPDIKLKALREVKNQIIGNRTKKLAFLKLGAIPAVASLLAAAIAEADSQLKNGEVTIADKNSNYYNNNTFIQSAAVLGSFACGFDDGVRAVLDAGALPYLIQLLSNPDEKVVDAGARSLRMIYQSKLTPKYEILQDKKMEFLLSLLNSESENVTGLGASIITHSCETSLEQKSLSDAGVLKKLLGLLEGSFSQRDASLESLAALFRNNPEVVSKFVGQESGSALSSIIGLTKDRYPRTRLLACMCLIVIRNSSPFYLQDVGIKTKLLYLSLELLDDPGEVGDEAPFVFSSLIMEKEDLQKLAFEANALEKFSNHLQNSRLHPKRLQGILLALADICSKLESCRYRFLSLEVWNMVTNALTHDSAGVRTAACICIRSVTRSIKNLCAGYFMNEVLVIPLVQLLNDSLVSVQGMYVLGNVASGNEFHKEAVMQQLLPQVDNENQSFIIKFLQSNDSRLRTAAVWAIVNLTFPSSPGAFRRLIKLRSLGIVPEIRNMVNDPCLDVKVQRVASVFPVRAVWKGYPQNLIA
ncbi:uncharacterized protein LOC110666697 isoform X3 [Hevea brasiliensis]|uniref:uncharacterized protein LOC110666697 isoform X3 n=1 Tax=Hevea brasiliensis TaxID=3981 RepID=UPI0025CF79D6|nr:uncharacterized protein LOC110666697 isoform X3 [Hevea brasiliensis]